MLYSSLSTKKPSLCSLQSEQHTSMTVQQWKNVPTCWLFAAYDSSSTWRIWAPSTSVSTWFNFWAAAPPLFASGANATQLCAHSINFKCTICVFRKIRKIGFLSSDKPTGRLTSEASFSVRDRKSLIAIVCHSINEFCLLCIFQANPLCYPT